MPKASGRVAALVLGAAFVAYVLLVIVTAARHEPWGDEIHSWNIARESRGLLDLVANTRYEGHPPLWYVVLWSISRVTHRLVFVQAAQVAIAAAVAFLVMFRSPLPLAARLLIPFGYFFLFEYGVLARNYAVGVLPLLGACLVVRQSSAPRLALYYALLLLAAHAHLLALLLGASLHVYLLTLAVERRWPRRTLALHAALGALALLPAALFIVPPSDSEMNAVFWRQRWTVEHFEVVAQAPLRAFVPVPAWWRHDFWNRQFLVDLVDDGHLPWFVPVLGSLAAVAAALAALAGVRKSAALFAVNLALTLALGMVFPLTAARYVGFVFVGFVVAYWLHCEEAVARRTGRWLVGALLALQVTVGLHAVARDLAQPFSNWPRVGELIAEVPAGERWVTDYWTANAVSAFTGRPAYCVGLDREVSFLLWNGELAARTRDRPYSGTMGALLRREGRARVFLLSANPPEVIAKHDPSAEDELVMVEVDRRDGAIQSWSNLYLYEVRAASGLAPVPREAPPAPVALPPVPSRPNR